MNARRAARRGASRGARAPALLARPYLRAVYDEPEFIVRNIWRLYGGWWDGNPAHLKPPADAELAAELAAQAGGAERLAARAAELSAAGRLALTCSWSNWALRAGAEPARYAEIYRRRAEAESSLMARGIFSAAALEPGQWRRP